MKRSASAVLKNALELPDDDRAEIAGILLDSLEPAADADIEGAWRQEVRRRLEACDSGASQVVPWTEVRDRLFARLSDAPSG